MNQALILANGKPPGKHLLQKFLASCDWFVCADGGANIAARFHCTPDLIIGDLDSIKKETLSVFSNVEVKKLKSQNSTDLEKALTAVIQKKFKNIIVFGATGGRLDHALGNLSALAKFSHKAHITFIDNAGKFFPVNHSFEFHLPIGTIISLLPLSRCSGIVTKGLKWNLHHESPELGVRESTSNFNISSPVSIKVQKGQLVACVITKT